MITDCAFTKGFSHEICQDYATTYSPDGFSQIILCDGCSSSKMTDVGARILAHTVAKNINKDYSHIERDLKQICFTLGIQDNSLLDATLLYTYFDNMINRICVKCYGDGFIIIKRQNGFEIKEIVFKSGYPFYFSYFLDIDRLENFRRLNTNFDYQQIIQYFDNGFNKYKEDFKTCYKFPFEFDIYDFEYIAFISDGLNSFVKKTKTDTSIKNESVDKIEVLKKLLTFKNFSGKFVQRRLNAFKKECELLGWDHYDDLSIAVMANK